MGAMVTPVCDAHVHFCSPHFFDTLGAQKGLPPEGRAAAVVDALGWDDPGSPDALADRWVAELDRHGVARATLIASVPGDEASVAAAVARHPARVVGAFMFDPTSPDPAARLAAAFDAGLRQVCLFPAMHRYALPDERVTAVFEAAAAHPGTAVFVHCGVLSVGARQKLGLPSPFDVRLGNPLDLHAVALRFGRVPIVVPHFGAGFFREALMLADLCPNVHLDTSSSNRWMRYTPGLTLPEVFRAALDVAGADRLLFGSDSSFFPRGWHRAVCDQQRAALAAIAAGPEVEASILGGNYQRLFP
jgi:predicted TIM-barrel fold metal-dependent hydrolase